MVIISRAAALMLRAEAHGITRADNVIEAAHMTYNAPRGVSIVEACIERLQEIGEIQFAGNKKNLSRGEKFGIAEADGIIETACLTGDVSMAVKMIESCIKRLQERKGEIQPKKADPKYKKARYDKKPKP